MQRFLRPLAAQRATIRKNDKVEIAKIEAGTSVATRQTKDAMGPPSIHISGLNIWVHGRQFPEATDYWDGNWLRVTAECGSSGAEVWVSGSIIHLPELARWLEAAEHLRRTLDGEANLECMEPGLSVNLAVDKLGRMLMTVNITPDNLSQQHSFRFEIDQSYLPELIRGCRAVLDSYPIRVREERTL